MANCVSSELLWDKARNCCAHKRYLNNNVVNGPQEAVNSRLKATVGVLTPEHSLGPLRPRRRRRPCHDPHQCLGLASTVFFPCLISQQQCCFISPDSLHFQIIDQRHLAPLPPCCLGYYMKNYSRTIQTLWNMSLFLMVNARANIQKCLFLLSLIRRNKSLRSLLLLVLVIQKSIYFGHLWDVLHQQSSVGLNSMDWARFWRHNPM